MTRGIVQLCLAALLAASAAASGERWFLDFEPVKMDRVLVPSGAGATPYWYLVYRVTNPGDVPIALNLSITAVPDVGNKKALEWHSPAAMELIQAREGKALKNVQEMRCEIGPGETVEAAALFRSMPEATRTLKVEIQGLSDRVIFKKGRLAVEDRVLVVTFAKPGDAYYPQFDRFILKTKKWVVL